MPWNPFKKFSNTSKPIASPVKPCTGSYSPVIWLTDYDVPEAEIARAERAVKNVICELIAVQQEMTAMTIENHLTLRRINSRGIGLFDNTPDLTIIPSSYFGFYNDLMYHTQSSVPKHHDCFKIFWKTRWRTISECRDDPRSHYLALYPVNKDRRAFFISDTSEGAWDLRHIRYCNKAFENQLPFRQKSQDPLEHAIWYCLLAAPRLALYHALKVTGNLDDCLE